jgi:hypothetical protein
MLVCKLHHCSAIEIFENLVDRTRVAFGGTLVEKQAVLSEFLRMFLHTWRGGVVGESWQLESLRPAVSKAAGCGLMSCLRWAG